MAKTKNISIITTVKHNIGDDFVREGIISLLNELTIGANFELIHKHSPVTSFYGFEQVRSLRLSRIIEPALRTIKINNRIDNANALIQSGAPIYWCHTDGPHCASTEWFDPLIRKRFLKDKRQRKFLNIAGGSCQKYHSDGTEITSCPVCKAYISEYFDACDLTLLRDDLARKMLNQTGRDAEVLPCTSIFARDHFGLAPFDGGYIVVNFMENGGHYTFNQGIDTSKWRKNFISIVNQLKKHGKVIAACHTPDEEKLAKAIAPGVETYIVPNEHVAFMEFYAGARFAIVNRVHAGFMMASFGKPVIVIGNDSRAKMITNLNLPSYYVDDVNDEIIDSMVAQLLEREHSYRDEIAALRSKARSQYLEKIGNALES